MNQTRSLWVLWSEWALLVHENLAMSVLCIDRVAVVTPKNDGHRVTIEPGEPARRDRKGGNATRHPGVAV